MKKKELKLNRNFQKNNNFKITESHPGLLELWRNDNPSIKWKLFVTCIAPNLATPDRISRFQNLPPDLILPTASLVFLYVSILHKLK